MDERFLEYRDKHDMTNSEALRELVRTGLEAESSSGTLAIAKILLFVGFLALAFFCVGLVTWAFGLQTPAAVSITVAFVLAVAVVFFGLGIARGWFEPLYRYLASSEGVAT